jgi:hypothetical protein
MQSCQPDGSQFDPWCWELLDVRDIHDLLRFFTVSIEWAAFLLGSWVQVSAQKQTNLTKVSHYFTQFL